MSSGNVLRLYLPGSWLRHGGACAWSLLTPGGKLIERGFSDPAHWPKADECEAVLSAEQASWLTVTLPEKLGRDADRIVAYALEEKLLEPPDAMHIVLCRVAGRSGDSAIVVGRARLREILEAASTTGRELDRLHVEMQLAPASRNAWSLCRFGESAFLRLGEQQALAVDWSSDQPPDALALAIARARASASLPGRLLVAAPSTQTPDLPAWSANLGVEVLSVEAFDPLTAPAADATNLLRGAFAPRRRTGWVAVLRLPMMILLLAGLLHTVLSVADWARLAFEARSLRQEAEAIFRRALPGSKSPLLNAHLQLQREVAAALRRQGQVGGDDMLVLFGLIAEVLPAEAQLRSARYERSALEVLAVLPEGAVGRIDEALRLRGYAADARTGEKADAKAGETWLRVHLR